MSIVESCTSSLGCTSSGYSESDVHDPAEAWNTRLATRGFAPRFFPFSPMPYGLSFDEGLFAMCCAEAKRLGADPGRLDSIVISQRWAQHMKRIQNMYHERWDVVLLDSYLDTTSTPCPVPHPLPKGWAITIDDKPILSGDDGPMWMYYIHNPTTFAATLGEITRAVQSFPPNNDLDGEVTLCHGTHDHWARRIAMMGFTTRNRPQFRNSTRLGLGHYFIPHDGPLTAALVTAMQKAEMACGECSGVQDLKAAIVVKRVRLPEKILRVDEQTNPAAEVVALMNDASYAAKFDCRVGCLGNDGPDVMHGNKKPTKVLYDGQLTLEYCIKDECVGEGTVGIILLMVNRSQFLDWRLPNRREEILEGDPEAFFTVARTRVPTVDTVAVVVQASGIFVYSLLDNANRVFGPKEVQGVLYQGRGNVGDVVKITVTGKKVRLVLPLREDDEIGSDCRHSGKILSSAHGGWTVDCNGKKAIISTALNPMQDADHRFWLRVDTVVRGLVVRRSGATMMVQVQIHPFDLPTDKVVPGYIYALAGRGFVVVPRDASDQTICSRLRDPSYLRYSSEWGSLAVDVKVEGRVSVGNSQDEHRSFFDARVVR